MTPFNVLSPASPVTRTRNQELAYNQLKLELVLGFGMGGYLATDRQPSAYEIICDPLGDRPTPQPLGMGQTRCWAVPKVFNRIVKGIDPDLRQAIEASKFWHGTSNDLDAILKEHELSLAALPIRDAVDFVHSCIQSTIKTLKFSHLSQVCGGPIEIAVVTTDRDFRWVRHKDWDVAIKEGHAEWKV